MPACPTPFLVAQSLTEKFTFMKHVTDEKKVLSSPAVLLSTPPRTLQ